jgi:DNA-binding XRE family transcriptional regulator
VGWFAAELFEPASESFHLGPVAFLVPGVRVSLRASKPEFRCEQSDRLPTQLRGRRRKLNLSVEEAAAVVGVRRWTFGLWENGQQRPKARYCTAIARFLGHAPQRSAQE